MEILNEMKLEFPARTENISFARATVSAFVSQLDPTLPEVEDISTAVSEAVTNAIVHGYEGDPSGVVGIQVRLKAGNNVEIIVEDQGVGINDPKGARAFGKTTQPEERIGIGFSLMEQCMDEVKVTSARKKDSTRAQPSGFFHLLCRSLGIKRGIDSGKGNARAEGTRVFMQKQLQQQGG